MREQLGQGVVEIDVLTDDQVDRRSQGLGAVALAHVHGQTGLGLRRGDEDKPRGRGVDRRRAELGQVIELADQVFGHGPVAPAVARARFGEQLGQNGVGHRKVAGGKGVVSHGKNLLNCYS
ncbi:hypothetical protein D3C86_1734040 [compost metagenome]